MASCFPIIILAFKYLVIQNAGIPVVKVKNTEKTSTVETEVKNIVIAKPLTNKAEAMQGSNCTKLLLEDTKEG